MAHVVVTPSQIGIGETDIFTVNVPNEKNSEVTGLKLQLPPGLDEVSPTVKPGWQVAATRATITWSGGAIPVSFNDSFTFRAQAPASAGQLDWKAYQTYADGTTVSWDQKPGAGSDDDAGTSGPYSVTKVVDDLTPAPAKSDSSNNLALIIAVVALALSLAALQAQHRKPRK